MDKQYASYAAQQAAALLGVDSPTGFTDRAAAWVLEAFQGLLHPEAPLQHPSGCEKRGGGSGLRPGDGP